MAEINSGIGRRGFKPSVASRKFTVTDETGAQNPQANYDFNDPQARLAAAQALQEEQAGHQFAQEQGPPVDIRTQHINAHQDKVAHMNRPTVDARRRIEFLTGIGRSTKRVEVDTDDGKVAFVMRTLKASESAMLAHYTGEVIKAGQVDGIYAIRVRTLAFVLHAIDEQPLDSMIGVQGLSPEEVLYNREVFLEEFDDGLVTYLYGEYSKLVHEHLEKFGIKTEADAKEVAQEVKKSSQGE